jgi:hypothetical protein
MPVETIEETLPLTRPASASAKGILRGGNKAPALGRAAQSGTLSTVTVIFMVLFHAGAVAALFMFSWKALICAAVLWIYASNIGIGMCYHRLLTHRGYKTPKWLEYFMAIGATLSLEGGPIFWVATHRVHHQLSDHEGDPHTPTEGGWWAHIGWILSGVSMHAETAMLVAEQISLGTHGCCGPGAFGDRRMAVRDVGNLPACDAGTPRYLAGELGNAHVGFATFQHKRPFAQQLVGGTDDRRRRVAQQPSRAPGFGTARAGLV